MTTEAAPEQESEATTFEDIRHTCALFARTKIFAELTLIHKVSAEIASACSAELYAEIQSLTIDQIEKKKPQRWG